MRILLVEDDKELCDAIKLQLERAGYETDCCGQGQEAFYYASEYPYDVIILDRMLPQMDGLGVLGGLRRMNITTPVIITTALDGINDSLKAPNPIEEMEEDTVVNLGFDKALLYKNMVAADADWLYGLEEWNDIFDEETRKKLYKEQKSSTTIVKEAKIYPNDPCPCGSGKKYKKCCGKNK